IAAKLALHDLRIETIPLELRNVEGTRDFAVTAADALCAVPPHHASIWILPQAAKHTSIHTARLKAVHALLFEVRVIRTIGRTVQLDDVLCEVVQRGRRLVDA